VPESPSPESLELTVEGRRIEALQIAGADPALVLLHEGLGSARLWRGFPAALAQATGRRVIAYSRFGHGTSDPPPAPRTPAFFEEEAHSVLPAILSATDASLSIPIGHSDGATIALIHASRHPVSGVVLMAPHVFAEPMTLEAIREARERYEHGDLRERLARHHADVDAAFWGWCGVWLAPEFQAWKVEAVVQAPALLIQGADDPYGSLAHIERVRARGPVRPLVLPGGHTPHFEHERKVVRAIARFCEHVNDHSAILDGR
jgi:pimeloyl-ACP methyl ester carboxylesterase